MAACALDGSPLSSFEKASGKGAAIAETFYQALLKGEGRVLLTACRPRQVAYELDQLGHGSFTCFLLEGLKGKADHDRDGSVTFDEVCRYVSESVPPKARERGGDQEPVKAGVQTGAIAVLPDHSVAIVLERVTVQDGDTVRRVSAGSGPSPAVPASAASPPPPSGEPESWKVAPRALTAEDRRAVEEAVKQWDALYRERDFDRALRAYRDAQDVAPEDAALLRKVALCQVRLSQLGRAVKALERAAAIAPADTAVLNTLSVVLLKAGERDRALMDTHLAWHMPAERRSRSVLEELFRRG